MNLKRFLSIAACVLLSFLSAVTSAGFMPISKAFAAGPKMNEAYTITEMNFNQWNYHLIPSSLFLSNAKKAIFHAKGTETVKISTTNSDNGIITSSGWIADRSDIILEIDETAVKNGAEGKLYMLVQANSSITMTITNCDENYKEPTSDDGNGGNPGGGTSSTFTGDRKGGYTAEELKAQYNPIDMEKVKLIISKKRQITHLPTIYINVPDIKNATNQTDINNVLFKIGNTADYHAASIKVVDDADESLSFEDNALEIKVRGNETAKGTKKPYRLKFAKDKKDSEGNVIESHKHDMLGYGYAKRNWTLIANQKDGSFAHNALSYHIGKAVGMDFCPGYRFVDLVINDVYLGCYMVSDHIEVGSNRIELEDENTGWYVESNRNDQVEDPYLECGGINVSIKSPEYKETDADYAAKVAALKKEVGTFFTQAKAAVDQYATNKALFCDPEKGWRAYFDEEALVKYYVGTNLTGNHDGFMTVKMSRDMGKKMKVGPLWDHDTAFGGYDDGETLAEDAQVDAPLFCGKFAQIIAQNDPVFIKKAHDLLHQVMDAGYMTDIIKHVEDITSLVVTSRTIESPYGDPFQTEIDKLKSYINKHSDWLVETIDDKYDLIKNQLPPDTPEPVHAQLTNLPTIYLNATVGDEWSTASVEVFDRDNKLNQGTETWTNNAVQAQYQGSGDKNKDSYRLKFDEKIKLFASGKKYKQWVLLANDDDPSMINNALAKELGDALGLPFTPGYQFVDLYVNETYMGTYQFTDRIKVEEGRAQVIDAANKDNKNSKDLDWHVRFNDAGEYNEDKPTYYIAGNETMPYIIPKNPDPKDDPSNWESTLKAQMTSYFNGIFSTDQEGNYTAFAEGIDQQQLIQWYIAQEVLSVYKGFSSIEAYRSVTAEDQKLHIGVLWDSEKAFGNTGEAPAIDMSDQDAFDTYKGLMISYAANDAMRKLFINLWQQEWFAEGVKKMWDDKRTSLDELTNKATEISSTLNASQSKNLEKWGKEASLGNFQSYDAAVGAVTSYLDTRFEYLDSKFSQLAIIASIDVPTMVNYILGIGTGTEGYKLADLNGDHVVDTQDLVILINAKNLK